MKKLILVISTVAVFISNATFAYTPTAKDINLWYELSERLIERLQQANWSEASYSRILTWLVRAKNRASTNPQYSYILEIVSNVVYDVYQKYSNTEYFAGLEDFRAEHDKNMLTAYDQPSNLSLCFKHYPIVDEYARRTNKPTPLILAMWYIETSCAMANPANRDGLFQIINNDYEPWIIDRAWLESQLNDFATFMDNKWNRYYSRNPQAPRDLWYTSFTYDTLQTFSALYNWIDLETGIKRFPLLNGNPYYFLSNYNADYKWRRDWLLVFFLKIAKLEAEYFRR